MTLHPRSVAFLLVALLSAGCSRTTPLVPRPPIEEIQVDPAAPSLAVGGHLKILAQAVKADGSTEALDDATYEVADAALVELRVLKGVAYLTGLQPGATRLTVRSPRTDKIGNVPLTVTGPRPVSLALAPSEATVALGGLARFTATVTFSDQTTASVTEQATWQSSDPAVADLQADAPGAVVGRKAGAARIEARYQDLVASAAVTVRGATLLRVEVAPPSLMLPLKATVPLSAVAVFDDSTVSDVTAEAAWTSGAAAIASVEAGKVTGLAAGEARITASYGGLSGTTLVTVTAAKLVAVELTPPTLQLAKGTTGSLRATALFDSGVPPQDATALAAWSSSDPKIASLPAGLFGAVRGEAPGTARISATLLGVTGTAAVTVTPATLASLAITPARASAPKGTSVAFTAAGTYSDGTTQDVTAQVLWSSSDEKVASVSNATGSRGVALARSPGAATIRASLGSVAATAALNVTAAEVASLAVEPEVAVLAKGTTAPLRARATLTDGNALDATDQADWTSSDSSIATVTTLGAGRGVVAGLKPGSATITAAFGGKRASATAVVTAATLTLLELEPRNPSLAKGATLPMRATGTYSDGTVQDVTALVLWSVVDAAIARVSNAQGAQGLVSALAAGKTDVVASLSGRAAKTTLTVTPATLNGLTVTPAKATLEYKATQQLIATASYSDLTSLDVTAQADWTSGDPLVASVTTTGSARGLVTGNSAGTTTITARFGGRSAQASITVNAPKLVRLEIQPATLAVPAGRTGTLACWAIYADASQVEVTTSATWSAYPGVARVDAKGVVTGVSPGTATVTAAWKGLSATAKVEVTAPLVETLTITPTAATIPAGGKQSFTTRAFLSDGSNQDVTAQTLFTSDDTSGVINLAANQATGMKAGGPVILTASYGGKTATARLTVTAPVTVTQLTLSPGFATVPVGGKQALTATALYSDGTVKDVTLQALFASADPATVSLDANTALGVKVGGPVTITATFGGKTATAKIQVGAAALVSLAVQPSGMVLQKGETGALKAIGTYSDGSTRDLTSLCAWDSTDFLVCSVTAGAVKGVGAGRATVTARHGGLEGKASIVVEAPVLTRIAITPPNAVLRPDLIYPYRAYALYSDSSLVEVPRDVNLWDADNISVASPYNYGGYFGLWAIGAGLTSVHVSYLGSMGHTRVHVLNSTITAVEISPSKVTLPNGTAAKLAGVFAYKGNGDGWAAEIQNPTWTSADPTTARVDANGVVTALKPGTTSIKLSAWDAFGGEHVETAPVQVTTASLRSIALTAPTKLVVGFTAKAQALGTFSDGTVMELGPSPVVWSTSDAALATVVPEVDGARVSARAPGSVTLSARLGSVIATVPLTLTATSLSGLALKVAQTSLPQGSTSPVAVQGTFADGTVLDLTESAAWRSSAPDVAEVMNGLFTNAPAPLLLAHAPDGPPRTAVISANFGGKTATAPVQVSGANLATLRLAVGSAAPSSTLTLSGGGPFRLRAVGTFSDGSTADVTAFCTFEPASPGPGVVATLSNASAGKVTVLAKGSEQVRVTYAPSYLGQPLVSGTATLIVP